MEASDPERINVIEGKYGIGDIVDLEQLQKIFELFTEATGFTINFLDHPGLDILIAADWRGIGTKLRRVCATAESACETSRQTLSNHRENQCGRVIAQTDNSLADRVVPMITSRKNITSPATDQPFSQEPGLSQLRMRARSFGFDEQASLQTLTESPAASREKLDNAASLLENISGIITNLIFANQALLEERERLTSEIADYRKTEKELAWKTAFLEAQKEAAAKGILVVDEQGKILRMNHHLQELWQVPRHIREGHDEALLLHHLAGRTRDPGELSHLADHLHRHPKDTSRNEIELIDGAILDQYTSPVLGRDGTCYGRIWTFRDVTSRERTEEELNTSEAWYRTIFENTGTAMIVVEEDTTISLANTEFENLTGYTKAEIQGVKSWTEFAAKEDLDMLMTQHRLRRVQPDFARKNYEFRLVNKDGQAREIHLTVDMIPNTKQSIASLLDITDRKRADETLKESQRRLSEIIEFFPDATLVVDKDGRVTAWNRAMEALTGVKAEDMLGRGNYEYAIPFHGCRRPILIDLVLGHRSNEKFERVYTNLLTEGGIIQGEGFASSLAAGERYCSAKAVALHDSRGETVAAIECVRDITEQKRIEDRLNRAEKMEALGTLAGGVAHDMNNFLGVLVGYSELLMETLPENSLQQRYARNILQSSERGAAIIQDLLTMARRGVSVSEVINLNKVIVDYLDSPEHEKLKSYHRNILVRTELEEDLFRIKGSPIHLIKTVMNLVSNAAEAISGEGIITIRTENRYLDFAVNGYEDMQEGDYVVLSVSDTGEGIPERDLGKIFEPFYTKKMMGRSGTGLGLAVVWGTVKDHHGFIDAKSEEGVGSTFTLYFPVTPEELIRRQEKSDIARYMGCGESILVVDDMAFQRELAVNLLSRLNYKVCSVSSGEAAIEYLKTHKVDLLLLDMLMEPGIDGLETFTRVRAIEPHQKAIIVSGFSEDERVGKAQELGAGKYVRKPYNLEKIGMAIRKELDRR